MGKTSFSGPLWGAKSLLFTVNRDNLAISTAAATIGATVVPAGEDWYITDFVVYRGSTGSTAFTAALLDDSTQIAGVAITSSAGAQSGSTQLVPDGGEYQGVNVASGSVLSATIQNGNSSVVGSSNVAVYAYGFPRWLQSSSNGF